MKHLYYLIVGKMKYQNFFRRVYDLVLKGMNIGEGANIHEDGEMFALKYIKGRLLKNKTENLVLFDVGANVGDYSATMAEIFSDQEIKIYSFEPSRKTFEQLKSRLGSVENINLECLALGEETGSKKLFVSDEHSSLSSLYKRKLDHFHISMNQSEEIKIDTLDNFCRNNNINHINFLKMDVEGHELSVLKGTRNMLDSANIDFIQFEFGGCNIDSRTYFQDFFYFLSPKYNIYRIVKNGLYPINKYDETLEIFRTTNFLAEKK